MDQLPPHAVPPFVFSDPAGKRWPRLRLFLLIAGVVALLGTVVFVPTLFVAPQLRVPVTLRQLKGQLKALETKTPGQPGPASLLRQKFGAARQAAKKPLTSTPAPPPKAKRKIPENEVRLAFYINGDPYSYT